MQERQTVKAAALEELERAAALARRSGLASSGEDQEIVDGAREQAVAALAGWEESDPGCRGVVPAFLAAVLVASERERDPGPEALEALVAGLPSVGLTTMELVRETLRSPELAMLEPGIACGLAMRLLVVCGSVLDASLWAPRETPELCCLSWAGELAPGEPARELARRLVRAGEALSPRRDESSSPRRELLPRRGETLGLAIERAGEPYAALVARPVPGCEARAGAFVSETSRALAAVLEREALMVRNAASERALSQAGERRLARLGFDLHDGPLQELALMGEDLALFREQLATVLEGRRGKEQLSGRLDDLDARLIALERALRRISTSLHASVLVGQPFEAALQDLLEPFVARSGIRPTVSVAGDLGSVSASQRIAVLSVVGEALNNIREHSLAREVGVSIVLDREGLRASVRDDGGGFEVEAELMRAARAGRMGLAGMHERVRLLGGHCRVDSRPGGPTEISLALPPWQPSLGALGQEPARAGG
jgi:signal transduction histidine kinase